jgi:histidine triad (HIT) family protein
MALALKAVRKCDAIWIVQNNEPASGQHAFHYHMHVFPRWDNDNLRELDIQGNVRVSDPAERTPYAEALKAYLANQ